MFWLTLVLVVITAYYAYVTASMAKAAESSVRLMKEQADAISRPYVTVSLVKQQNNPFIHLKIENTGQTAAQNLKLSLGLTSDAMKEIEDIRKLSNSHMFKQGAATFPPRSPLYFLIGFGSNLRNDDKMTHTSETFSVTATYSFSGQKVTETTVIDVKQYDDTTLETDPVVDALMKIKDEIAKKK